MAIDPIFGSVIGAGANLASGYMQSKAQQEANAVNAANALRNIELQRDFAQKGIRWKVADAKKAGIHPLFALGAQTTSFSPVSVGAQAETGMATGLAAAGQDLSRAIHATRTADERSSAVGQTMQELTLKNMGLRNDLLAAQIAKINQAGGNPPMPGGDRSLTVFETSPPIRTPGAEAPAEKVENEWGEFAGDVSGGIRFTRDALRAHGVPLGKTPAEYSQLLGNWLLSDAAKMKVSIVPGSPLDKFLRSLPAFGGR